jgi:entry exclusion lipoprotein TrbK
MKCRGLIMLAAAVLVAAMMTGCGKDEQPAVKDPVQERMEDKAYLDTLKEQRGKQDKIVARLRKAQDALTKAEADGVGQAKIAELKAAVARAAKDFEESRKEMQRIVSRRMNESLNVLESQKKGK